MEKELVKQLGEKIGYGNMMQLASECWEEMMIAKGYPTSGVFIPALKSDVRGLKIDTDLRQSNIPDVSLPVCNCYNTECMHQRGMFCMAAQFNCEDRQTGS